MKFSNDIHFQFAECFEEKLIRPYAYFLSKNLLEGNICIPVNEPLNRIKESPYTVEDVCNIDKLSNLTSIVTTNIDRVAPFVLEGNRLYLQRYYRYETIITNRIKELVDKGNNKLKERKELLNNNIDLIKSLNVNYEINHITNQELKIDWQIIAVIQALLQDFSIISGGPGTGKTTTLKKLFTVLYSIEPNSKIALAAPTGKASMRMYDSLNKENEDLTADLQDKFKKLKPSTIHSMLGYKKDSVNFKYNSSNNLPFDWIIIDEASMIDVPMFAKVLDAMSPTCRIILLGDKDQLASVEAGSLLGDLCLSINSINYLEEERINWINNFIIDTNRKISIDYIKPSTSLLANCVTELKYSHRFNKYGEIGKLSNAVLNNNVEELLNFIGNPNDTTIKIDTNSNNNIITDFSVLYRNYIEESDTKEALKKLNDIRILVAVREGNRGLYAINKKIEQELLSLKLINIDKVYYENRPVIVTRNMNQLGLFNGDIGIVREGRVWFDIAGETSLRSFLPSYLTNTETVFAMTIHKSQGSEFSNVLIVLPEGVDSPLLTRELLYTGITRAKTKVTIWGQKESILQAAKSTVERVSGISSKLA